MAMKGPSKRLNRILDLEMQLKVPPRTKCQELLELYQQAAKAQRTIGFFPQQRGGFLKFLLRPLLRLFGKKAMKTAAKRVAKKVTKQAVKRVAKKAGKKAALGAATAAGSWATQKALDSL